LHGERPFELLLSQGPIGFEYKRDRFAQVLTRSSSVAP
jgi:hypothetical protein